MLQDGHTFLNKNTIVAQLFLINWLLDVFYKKDYFIRVTFIFFTEALYISEYTDLDKLVDRLAIYNQFESW